MDSNNLPSPGPNPDEPQPDPGASKSPPSPKRRRRWPYAVVTVFLALVVLAVLAPYLASTRPGTRLIASIINASITGRIELDALALSWSGPSEARGLHLFDPAGRQVLRIASMERPGGVWSLLKNPCQLGQITVHSPEAALALNEEGQLRLAAALRSRHPSGKPLPDIKGTFLLESGRLQVQPRTAPAYEIQDIQGQVALDSLSNWEGTLRLSTPGGGTLQGKASIRDLLKNDRFDLFQAVGAVALQTLEPVDAAAVAACIRPDAGVTGKARLDLNTTFDAGSIKGSLTSEVAGLSATGRSGAMIRPVNMTLISALSGTRDHIDADLKLAGEPGKAQSRIAFRPDKRLLDIDLQQVLASILTAETVALPDFEARTNAAIDISRLAQAVPALLNLREGVQVTAGNLAVNDLTVHGGAEPAASGKMQLTGIRAVENGRNIEFEPIAAEFDTVIASHQGLQLRRAELSSGFAHVSGAGAASGLNLKFDADLARMSEQAGRIFDLSGLNLGGQFAGTAKVERSAADLAALTVDLTGRNVRYSGAGRELQFTTIRAYHQGQFAATGTRLARWTADQLRLDLDNRAVISGKTSYTFTDGAFQADLQMDPAAIEYVSAKLRPLGISLPEGLDGNAAWNVVALRSGPNDPVHADGRLLLTNLTRDGKPIGRGDATLTWTQARYAPGGTAELDSATLQSSFANAGIRKLVYATGPRNTLTAELDVDAQVSDLMAAVAQLAAWEKRPDLAGRLKLAGKLSSTGEIIAFTGQGGIEDFAAGTGERAVRDPHVQFTANARLDPQKETIAIQQFDLTSRLAGLRLNGDIDQYRTARNLNLACAYDAHWEPLVAMLHQFVPATTELVAISGESSGEFALRGPLNDPSAKPAYRGLTAQPALTWSSAALAGLSLGQARLAPQLANGRLTIPETAIPASGGTLSLAGTVDLTNATPLFRLPGRHQVLANIRVNRQLSHDLLSRFNPIFAEVEEIDGPASLAIQDLVLPLGGDLRQAGGSGKLALGQMRLRPRGFLNTLLELGSAALSTGTSRDLYTVQMSDVDFLIQNGRIRYDNFTLLFADKQFDLKFYGSVGLDDTLDLVVSVPVRPALLERFGVKGPLLDTARVLAGLRVDIPVTGTRGQPRLDLSKVNVKQLLARATQKGLQNEAGNVIGNIIGDPAAPAAGQTPAPPDARKIGGDVLKGVLGGKTDERNRAKQRGQQGR